MRRYTRELEALSCLCSFCCVIDAEESRSKMEASCISCGTEATWLRGDIVLTWPPP